MTPSVSITILSYNYEVYLAEALASALGQELGAYSLAEVVVIDDGSTDGSLSVCKRFPGARSLAKRHEGFGPTLSRAIQEASGEWIALLDADDAFTPDKLRTVAPYLADPSTLLIQHAEYVVGADGCPFGEGTHPGGSTSTLLVRAEAARDLLPVTNELFFHVFANLGRGVRLDDRLTRYRVHDASMTDRKTPGVFADYMATVCSDVAARLEQLQPHRLGWARVDQLASLVDRYRSQAVAHRDRAQRQRDDAPR